VAARRLLLVLAPVVALLAAACSGDGASGPASATAGMKANPTSLPSGVSTGRLTSDGRERTYRLYVPSSYDGASAVPLVIVLHGGGGTAESIAATTRFDAESERGGFIVVYPQGNPVTATQPSWNDGRQAGAAEGTGAIDDVAFIGRLIDHLSAAARVDGRRVYVAGVSNGGMLAYRLACQLSERIAAIAAVAATMTYRECRPAAPVSVLHIHGTADRYVPFLGGVGIQRVASYKNPPVPEVIERWRQLNGCNGAPWVESDGSRGDLVTTTAYSGCRAGVEVKLITVEGAGHGWLGRGASPGDRATTAIDSTSEIWRFFAAHPKARP
jgi:polyhydroxybutyrate depolymerase